MGRSLALSLYLFLAERGAAAADQVRPPRPEGRLIWIHAGRGSRPESLRQLIRLLTRDGPDLSILVTDDNIADEAPPPAPILSDHLPNDRLPDVRGFLDHWQPDLALFIGATLPPALITETHNRGIPLILADIRLTLAMTPRWRRGMSGSVLGRFSRILAQDPETADTMQRLAGSALAVELGGRIEETTDPLACVTSERDALAEILRARPVWLAAACPEIEEDAVITAHLHAMQHSHRLLLILAPADPDRATHLAKRLTADGLMVALRANDEDPLPEIQVLIADGMSELGLWYRLAPVCYMGGTLFSGGAGRTPFEPAALGSAILHGANPGPYPDAYARLAEARATRLVTSAEALAAAVEDLIAPDRAAVLAHNAWAATSGGAEVAERVVQIVLSTLATAADRKAVA